MLIRFSTRFQDRFSADGKRKRRAAPNNWTGGGECLAFQPPAPSHQPPEGSEEQLQTELDVSLGTLSCDAPERSARRVRRRVVQVRMVREVERLRPELHPCAGGCADRLEERDVPALSV